MLSLGAVDAVEALKILLRPAGGGLYLVSTGLAEQRALQQQLYAAGSGRAVQAAFEARLARIAEARVVLLALPSDVGAGFRRGANLGPMGIRTTLLERDPHWAARSAELGVVDLGDVFVVPQLLHDAMLSPAQLASTRRALYPQLLPDARDALPVSPLSIAERALDLVFQLNPSAAPVLLGGDHSCAWPAVAALARTRADRNGFGIVQMDAHTDLLFERLGVQYCFATWSYHANELLGRKGRLVQVGIRASQRPKSHWESTLGVRQFWAEECRKDPAGALDAILDHLHASNIESVYFSNDIDGTDAAFADATGTPEPDGLSPEFVRALIDRLGRELHVIGGDIMEVAPPLGSTQEHTQTTLETATDYLRHTLGAILGAEEAAELAKATG